VQRQTGVKAVQIVGTVTCSTNQVPDSDHMHPSFLFRVRILNEDNLRIGIEAFDLRQFNEVINALAVKFEVEASVLEGAGQFDDRLADILDLLLA
jgi:hypothetical protein